MKTLDNPMPTELSTRRAVASGTLATSAGNEVAASMRGKPGGYQVRRAPSGVTIPRPARMLRAVGSYTLT